MKKFKMPPVPFRKLVSSIAGQYRWVLGLQDYGMPISWVHEDEPRSKEDPESLTAMKATVDRRYLSCRIQVFPMVWKGWIEKRYTDEDVRKMVAHEVSHITTQHLADLSTAVYKDIGEFKDAWESCTERFAQILYRLEKFENKRK